MTKGTKGSETRSLVLSCLRGRVFVVIAVRRQQEAPYTYAITGARIVPVSGADDR